MGMHARDSLSHMTACKCLCHKAIRTKTRCAVTKAARQREGETGWVECAWSLTVVLWWWLGWPLGIIKCSSADDRGLQTLQRLSAAASAHINNCYRHEVVKLCVTRTKGAEHVVWWGKGPGGWGMYGGWGETRGCIITTPPLPPTRLLTDTTVQLPINCALIEFYFF